MTRGAEKLAGEHGPVRVLPLAERERASGGHLGTADLAHLDAIFFTASNTQHFASEGERNAFRERWLGRYLQRYPAHAFLAVAADGCVVGYLAGCLDDPAREPLFADVGYFPVLADLTQSYPAHLHINLDAGWRGRGIGARLIEAFAAHAAAAGSTGVHVVTGESARNVDFYRRSGFQRLRTFERGGARLVMLGRRLT